VLFIIIEKWHNSFRITEDLARLVTKFSLERQPRTVVVTFAPNNRLNFIQHCANTGK
jgi:hypothetical protein